MKLKQFAELCGAELPKKLDKRYSNGYRAGYDEANDIVTNINELLKGDEE